MAKWVEPKFSRSQVDRAGKILRQDESTQDETNEAMEVLGNWRASHSYPLSIMQLALRVNATRVCTPKAIVAQRLKRSKSILEKLVRNPGMSLKKMQDIAGCRAIVNNMPEVNSLLCNYLGSDMHHDHEFVNMKDYIDNPKEDGYRGVHLVYKFRSDIAPIYNDHMVEIQIRTKVQHAWATAVETVDVMNNTAMKLGRSNADWSKFFIAMSQYLAIGEGTVPDPPDEEVDRIYEETQSLAQQLDVVNRLKNFRVLFSPPPHIKNPDGYHLLHFDALTNQLRIRSYPVRDIEIATDRYTQLENESRNRPGAHVVLVSAADINGLKKAYPNYFADTDLFLALVQTKPTT
jgi:ppGpp synthetase/RelA/SpoT-type nucleotidyltranferase